MSTEHLGPVTMAAKVAAIGEKTPQQHVSGNEGIRVRFYYVQEDEPVVWAQSCTGRVFFYSPTTQLWHLNARTTPADPHPVITSAELMKRIAVVPRFNERFTAQRQRADELRAQIANLGEVITSAEAGLTVKDMESHRPITAPGMQRLLESRGSTWTTVARYDASSDRSGPYKAVQNYLLSDRFSFSLDAYQEFDPPSGHIIVRIRREDSDR